jgi:hypothetical protein
VEMFPISIVVGLNLCHKGRGAEPLLDDDPLVIKMREST